MSYPANYVRKNIKSGNVVSQCILYVIGTHADNDTGECHLALETIADEAQCTRRSVQIHIKRLSADRLLAFRRSDQGYVFKIVGYQEHVDSAPKREVEHYSSEQISQPEVANVIRHSDHGQTKEIRESRKIANVVRRSAYGAANDIRPNSVEREDSLYIYNNTPYSPPLTNLDNSWEESPEEVSDQIENHSRPVGSFSAEEPREIAKRKAAEATAKKISTNNWPSVYRANDPQKFDAWIDWFRQHNYIGQVRECTRRGFVFVPCEDVSVGAEIYLRKFPLAKPAVLSNDTLSAKETA